jgi:TonB-linked SusC/RagA family outer membrane protein
MKILFKCFLCLLISALWVVTLSAQDKAVIRGSVKSKTDNQAVIGASVTEVDKENRFISGTTTDANGNFALKVTSLNNKITIAFIGFKTIVEDIQNRTLVNFVIEEDQVQLATIVITAKPTVGNGFMNVDERELTTTVKKINAKELEDIPAASIDDALQGRLAGVDIVGNSGDPGSGTTIKIRGMASLTGNSDPLIVIDNVPVETRLGSQLNQNATNEQFAQLLNISPDDIKDITVQVDAASTAIWGTRGSNGVILITTKRGSKGKVSANYTYRTTYSFQPSALPMLNGNEYKTLISEEVMNPSNLPFDVNAHPEFRNDITDGATYYNYSQNTDWIKKITRTGKINEHNLSFTGGGDKAIYRASVGYWDQTGTTLGTGMKRVTTSMKVDYQVSDRLKFSSDIRYAHVTNDNSYTLYNLSTKYNIRDIAYKKMPNMSIYNYSDLGKMLPVYFSPTSNVQGSFPDTYNPVAMANDAKNQTVNENIVPTFRVSYGISKSLNFASDISFTIDDNKTSKFLPQSATGLTWNNNYVNLAEYEDQQTYDVYTNNRISFSPDLGPLHKLTSVLGVVTSTGNGYWNRTATANTASSELKDATVLGNLYNGATWDGLFSTKSNYKSYSGYLAVNYTFKDRYSFNVTIRSDADPKYGKEYMYGTFAAYGAKWRVSQEDFMKPISFITELALRANYGTNGNSNITANKYANYLAYKYDYAGTTGIYQDNLELDNFRWEKKIQRNVGFNVRVFNRMSVDFTAYNDQIKDGFVSKYPIPSNSGFSSVALNMLKAHNKGFELDINTTIIQSAKGSLDLRFNCGSSQFVIDNVSDQATVDVQYTPTKSGEFQYYPRDHTPMGSIYGYKYLGVYKNVNETYASDAKGVQMRDPKGQPLPILYNYPNAPGYQFQPGDAKYLDVNNDGNINYNDVVYLGNSNPSLTGGFGSRAAYKDLYFDVFFNFRYNYLIVNRTKVNTENMNGYDNQSASVLKRWRQLGDITDMPRATYGLNYNSLGSDRFTEDGSFLRLKQITLGYNLKKELINKVGIKDCKINITITNLLTFTNYSGQDPEVSPITDPTAAGYQTSEDIARTPRSREFTVGLSIGF